MIYIVVKSLSTIVLFSWKYVWSSLFKNIVLKIFKIERFKKYSVSIKTFEYSWILEILYKTGLTSHTIS